MDESGGDGGSTTVDNSASTQQSTQSIHYFFAIRKKYNGAGQRIPGDTDTSVYPTANDLTGFVQGGFIPLTLDAVGATSAQVTAGQSTRMVIAGATNGTTPVGAVYEANNEGTAANASAVNWT